MSAADAKADLAAIVKTLTSTAADQHGRQASQSLPEFDKFARGLSDKARGKLQLLASRSDVLLQTADGHFYPVHKVRLAEHSSVFRGVFFDLSKETAVKVEEDATGFAPLLEFVYAERYMTFDKRTTVDLCRSLLVLAEKYDVPELCELCDGKLELQVTTGNLPAVYTLAVKHSLKAAQASCKIEAASRSSMKAIIHKHGTSWLLELPSAAVVNLLLAPATSYKD